MRPATDRVYIFRYGAEEKSVEFLSASTYLPISFLHDFNVVDTPGTNTMVAAKHHREFIPRADLVFSSSRLRTVVPIRVESAEVRRRNGLRTSSSCSSKPTTRRLRSKLSISIFRHGHKGWPSPADISRLRSESAPGRTTGLDKERLWKESCFGPLEDQINLMVAESGVRILKLQSTSKTAGVILGELAEEIGTCFDIILRDEKELSRVGGFLQARRDQTMRQVAGFLRGVEQACRECAKHGTRLLEEKLSFWRTWRLIWSREQWQQEFQTSVEAKLRQTIQPQVENAVQLLETDRAASARNCKTRSRRSSLQAAGTI